MTWGMSKASTSFPTHDRAGYPGGGGRYAGDGYAGGGGYSNMGYGGGGYGGGGYGGGNLGSGIGHGGPPAGGGGSFFDTISGLKSADNSAALHALTLLSFLFFLNLLQNQLSSTGSQTLVFTVGSGGTGNGTTFGRRRRSADEYAEVWGRDFELEMSDQYQKHLQEVNWLDEEDEEVMGADSGAGRKPSKNQDKGHSSSRLKGEMDADKWHEVTSNLMDLLSSSALPPHLADTFSRCRHVVACTLHHATPHAAHEAVKAVTGENSPAEACPRSLTSAEGECGNLARTLASLVQSATNKQRLKHDPHDFL